MMQTAAVCSQRTKRGRGHGHEKPRQCQAAAAEAWASVACRGCHSALASPGRAADTLRHTGALSTAAPGRDSGTRCGRRAHVAQLSLPTAVALLAVHARDPADNQVAQCVCSRRHDPD